MSTESTERIPDETPAPPVTLYTDTLAAFLTEARWLDPILDGPFIVHAKSLAQSLDQQLTKAGEVQSALASTYAKVMGTLLRNRPAPVPSPTDPAAPSADGTVSIFTQLG